MGGKHKQQQVHRSPPGRRAGWWGKLAVAIQEIVFQSSLQLLTRETPHLRAIRLGRKWTECGLTMMESDAAAARRQTDGRSEVRGRREGGGKGGEERREGEEGRRHERSSRGETRATRKRADLGHMPSRLRSNKRKALLGKLCNGFSDTPPPHTPHPPPQFICCFFFKRSHAALEAARRTSERSITGKMEGTGHADPLCFVLVNGSTRRVGGGGGVDA